MFVEKKQYQTTNRPLLDNPTLLNSDQFFDIKKVDSSITPLERPGSTQVPSSAFAKTASPSGFDFFDKQNIAEASEFPTFSKEEDFTSQTATPNSFDAFDAMLGQKEDRSFKKPID